MLKKIFFSLFALTVVLGLTAQESIEKTSNKMQEWSDIEGKEFFVFVDKSSKATKPLGSKNSPFRSIDDAFSFLSLSLKKHTKVKATINVKGSFATEYSYIITYPTKIVGMPITNNDEKNIKSNINFGKNAGFIVTSSFLILENIHVTRRELVNEPRTVPLLYSFASNVIIKDTDIYAKEGGTVCNFLNSNFSILSSTLNSTQNGYSSLIEANNSKGKISSSQFSSSARSIIAVDVKNSSLTITNLNAQLTCLYFAFFARVFDSTSIIENSSFVAKGSGKAKEAIMYNDKSNVKIQTLNLDGFEKESSMKNGKLDYMK